MTFLDDLFRGVAPPRSNAFTPEQMEEFRRQAAALPAAPSGSFFQVPANSPDRQAGQLLPLTNGQPTTVMAKGLNFPSVWGAEQTTIPRAPTEGIAPLMAQVAPPTTTPPPTPKDSFAIPPMGSTPRGDSADEGMREAVIRAGGNPDFVRVDRPGAAATQAAGPAAAGSPEDIVRRALEIRRQVTDSTNPSSGPYIPGRGYGGHLEAGDQAMRIFLDANTRDMARQGQMDLQRLENQGRMDAAGMQGRGDNLNTAKLKAIEGLRTGQITPGQFESYSKLLSGAATATPEGMRAAAAEATQQANTSREIDSLRGLLGSVNPTTNRVEGVPPTGQAFSQIADRLRPESVPAVVDAIRAGQFGDPIAVRNAAVNSLAQNYLMSQGRLPGGEGNVPGRYTIPYGGKPLLDLVATPPSTMMGVARGRLNSARSGVPYDSIRLPDGSQIPFDQSGVQGLSNMASTLGYNQQGQAAKARLSQLAQLVQLLQSTPAPAR